MNSSEAKVMSNLLMELKDSIGVIMEGKNVLPMELETVLMSMFDKVNLDYE